MVSVGLAGEPKRYLISQNWQFGGINSRQGRVKTEFRLELCDSEAMKMLPDRAVLNVVRHNHLWAVEHEGDHFGHAADKEVVKATANKRARDLQDRGQACQVRVLGENGFFPGRPAGPPR
jgi:hypothetical protein